MAKRFWLLLACLLGVPVAPLAAQTPTKARELVASAIEAHGGTVALERLYNAQWKGRGLLFRDDQDTKPLAFFADWSAILPAKYRYTFAFKGAGANFPVTTGLLGDLAWRTMRPQQTADEMPAHLVKAEQEDAHAWYVTRLVPLLSNDYQLMVLPAIERDQQTMLGLKVDRKGFRSIYLFFHRQKRLLSYMDRKIVDADTKQEILQETSYLQFREMGGALLPQSITVRRGKKLYMELQIQSVTAVASLPDSHFEKPVNK